MLESNAAALPQAIVEYASERDLRFADILGDVIVMQDTTKLADTERGRRLVPGIGIFLALTLGGIGSLQAKPIGGCFGADSDDALCEAPPASISIAQDRSTVVELPTRVARLSESDSRCAELQGTHQARGAMLTGIESRLQAARSERKRASTLLNSARSSRESQARLTAASARLSTANANLAVLETEFRNRTKSYSRSLRSLSKGCGTS